jgi:hypothetical protein
MAPPIDPEHVRVHLLVDEVCGRLYATSSDSQPSPHLEQLRTRTWSQAERSAQRGQDF